jgi:hypothetical protein
MVWYKQFKGFVEGVEKKMYRFSNNNENIEVEKYSHPSSTQSPQEMTTHVFHISIPSLKQIRAFLNGCALFSSINFQKRVGVYEIMRGY